jgi:hypothetical protein
MQHHASGQHYDAELNKYPYMKTRNKAYPWSCADCGLFNQKWCSNLYLLIVFSFLHFAADFEFVTAGMSARGAAAVIIR